ncbi:MAG: lipocalin family protein, partial [Chloroflexota bacterium]
VLTGATADYQIALNLRPGKPPVLHGHNGYIGVAASEMSYYYSRTRLVTEGTVTDHGRPVPVSGEVWMDHQWGDFSLDGGGGWDWLGVQLSDATDLMVSAVRNGAGEPALTYGTLVGPQGEAEHLSQDQVRVRSTGQWTSPKTGAVYPMGWVLEVAHRGLELTVEPVVLDQELDTRDTVGRAYWEGEVRVVGAAGGNPVEGLGYVELTGYAGPRSQGTGR